MVMAIAGETAPQLFAVAVEFTLNAGKLGESLREDSAELLNRDSLASVLDHPSSKIYEARFS